MSFYVKKEKNGYFMRLLGFECPKRLKALSQAISEELLKFQFCVKKNQIFQCMGNIFVRNFKYVTHSVKDENFIQCWNFKNSQI